MFSHFGGEDFKCFSVEWGSDKDQEIILDGMTSKTSQVK